MKATAKYKFNDQAISVLVDLIEQQYAADLFSLGSQGQVRFNLFSVRRYKYDFIDMYKTYVNRNLREKFDNGEITPISGYSKPDVKAFKAVLLSALKKTAFYKRARNAFIERMATTRKEKKEQWSKFRMEQAARAAKHEAEFWQRLEQKRQRLLSEEQVTITVPLSEAKRLMHSLHSNITVENAKYAYADIPLEVLTKMEDVFINHPHMIKRFPNCPESIIIKAMEKSAMVFSGLDRTQQTETLANMQKVLWKL